MTAVFSHGRLRLYLLKLLDEGPKHGYELIRLLENRFLGLYAPSAGTIYPRLSRMETEGLVTHTAAGGRKVYEITDAGRQELAQRAGELADLEREIHASVADLTTLATEIEQQVSGSVRDIKRELRDAAREARSGARPSWSSRGWGESAESWASQARERADAGRRAEARRAGATRSEREPTATPTTDTAAPNDAPADGNPTDASPADDASTALEQALLDLAAEVRRIARRSGLSESELRAATAVAVSALTELRRRLR